MPGQGIAQLRLPKPPSPRLPRTPSRKTSPETALTLGVDAVTPKNSFAPGRKGHRAPQETGP
eukprot:5562539-Pyramimonas_sp.AAC.1